MVNILLLLAILPVIGLCSYIYKKDIHKEPFSLLMKIFFLGFFSAIPIYFLEKFLSSFFVIRSNSDFFIIFVNVFISIAFIEEVFKWFITKKFGFDNNEFDEIYDVIVYSVFASLGFACIENILYVFNYGIHTSIIRALFSIPGHTCFGIIMGYYFSKAKVNQLNNNLSLYKKNMMLSIIMPTTAHSLYDAFLLSPGKMYNFLFYAFYAMTIVLCVMTTKKTSTIQQNLNTNINNNTIVRTVNNQISYQNNNTNTQVNYCPICGSYVKGNNYCGSCGLKINGL